MEKIKLNNQVVHMRKYVKQAKVHVINKLVKQIKLLQNRNGNEAQVQKAKRKAERFLQEVTLLKKMKPDDISKLALSKAKNWKDVLQQKNSTLNDRCIAMLSNYEAVQKEVEIFHKSNQDLVSKMTDLIKQWEEKNKLLKNSSKGKKNISERVQEGKHSRKDEGGKNAPKENMESNRKHLNDKSDLKLKTDNDPFREEEKLEQSLQIADDCKLKNNLDTKVANKQNKIFATESLDKLCESNSDHDIFENTSEIKELHTESDNDIAENTSEIDDSDIGSESDEETIENIGNRKESDASKNLINRRENKELNDIENYENIDKTEDSHSGNLEDDTMEVQNSDGDEESEPDDSESVADVIEKNESQNAWSQTDVKKISLDTSELIKKMDSCTNNSKKKLKAIALLNLDELEGLDEIPVNTVENSESGEESEEDKKMDLSQNKRNDPFFLGCGNEDSVDKRDTNVFKNDSDTPKNLFFHKKNEFFERRENTSNFRHNKPFQKFSNSSQFSTRDSAKFRNDRDFQSFQRHKFKTRNYQDNFPSKNKNTFDRSKFRSENFKEKSETYSPSYKRKKHENKSKDLYLRNGIDSSSVKHKGPSNEEKSSNKPLHPSWEAKRKQKELINTSFQGKRMVFND